MGRLKREFFARDTITVAKDLLGEILVRKIGEEEIRARIIETEAYCGEKDQACHARFGKTKRNAPMYGEAGHAYIYLCYGIHELFNIVTRQEGCPEAVLIRKVELISPKNNRQNIAFEYDRTQKLYCANDVESVGILGPGKLTKYLIIDRELNGEDLTKSKKLWVEDDGLKKSQIHPVKSPHSGVPRGQFNRVESAERIGVSYAGKWAKKKWRFYLE